MGGCRLERKGIVAVYIKLEIQKTGHFTRKGFPVSIPSRVVLMG
jgi:hypothetical protein